MKKTIAVITLLTVPLTAFSQAISLPQWNDNPSVTRTETRNYHGRCGSAVVNIYGVTGIMSNFYTLDSNSGALVVANPKKQTRYRFDQESATKKQLGGMVEDLAGSRIRSPLSDHNGIACLDTGNAYGVKPGAKRIVTWSNCAGSACSGDWSFTIVDPETLAISGAAVMGSPECDATCTAKRLGLTKLPLNLR